MIICPNLKNPEVAREFNELVLATSEAAAYHIWSLNNGNAIDKAPNGAESKLFLDYLLLFNGDRTKAIQAKAKVYSNSFLNWFGNWLSDNKKSVSKVVDENGEPLIVYHGGKTKFNIFNTKIQTHTKRVGLTREQAEEEALNLFTESEIKIIKSKSKEDPFSKLMDPFVDEKSEDDILYDKFLSEAQQIYKNSLKDIPQYRIGSFFTSDSRYAKTYGNSNYAVFLNIKNPDFSDYIHSMYTEESRINRLKEEGYDGIYGHDVKGRDVESKGTEYVVFEPNQIKSATDNNDMFSTKNDNIYYQILTDSEYSEMIEELELSRDSTDSFIYNFVTKVLKVRPNYKFDENLSDSVWYSYGNTNIDPLYTNRERTEKLIRKIFGYDANIVFNDKLSLIKSINEELDHWVENLKNIIENPLDLSDFYKTRRLIRQRIEMLKRYNRGKRSLTDIELQQVLNYVDNLNSKASKYSKLTEPQRIGYEIVKLRGQLLNLEQQIQSLIFKRHSIIVSAKNRLVAINTIDNIQDLIKNRILLEYEAYQPKDDFINQKVLPFENLLKKIKKATLSNDYENRIGNLINLDQQTDINYDELYKIVTKNHQEFANLIKLFRSANPDLKIKIGGDPEMQLGGIVPGKFHPKTNTLTLYNGCDVYTIIHELAHSATFFGIFGKSEKSEEFSKKIETFMNYIRKYISDNKLNPGLFRPNTLMGVSLPAYIYGFTNESEFIAELYGNPSFLDLLDSIPPMNKKEFNSLLQEFIYTIIEFFNNLLGKNRIHKSALDLAKELGLISIKLQKDHIEAIYQQLHDINDDNFNNLLNYFTSAENRYSSELNEKPVAPVINELALVRQLIADLEQQINKIIKTQREVRNKYVNNERHVNYSIDTKDGPIYATYKHLDNGKSIFGLVTINVDINKNTVSSILLDPTFIVEDTIGLNFNRLNNSIKSNFYNLSYNLLQMFLLEGKNTIYTESKNYEINKRLVKLILANDLESKKIAEEHAKPIISQIFGEDAWKAYSIHDEYLVDLTKYNDQELGFSGVLYYGFKINVEQLANAIKSEHPEVKINNEFIKLILATQDDSNLKPKDDIEFGKLWISKLDLLIHEINTLLQPLKKRERKLKNDNINEMLSLMRALGENLEEECGGLPF